MNELDELRARHAEVCDIIDDLLAGIDHAGISGSDYYAVVPMGVIKRLIKAMKCPPRPDPRTADTVRLPANPKE